MVAPFDILAQYQPLQVLATDNNGIQQLEGLKNIKYDLNATFDAFAKLQPLETLSVGKLLDGSSKKSPSVAGSNNN